MPGVHTCACVLAAGVSQRVAPNKAVSGGGQGRRYIPIFFIALALTLPLNDMSLTPSLDSTDGNEGRSKSARIIGWNRHHAVRYSFFGTFFSWRSSRTSTSDSLYTPVRTSSCRVSGVWCAKPSATTARTMDKWSVSPSWLFKSLGRSFSCGGCMVRGFIIVVVVLLGLLLHLLLESWQLSSERDGSELPFCATAKKRTPETTTPHTGGICMYNPGFLFAKYSFTTTEHAHTTPLASFPSTDLLLATPTPLVYGKGGPQQANHAMPSRH